MKNWTSGSCSSAVLVCVALVAFTAGAVVGASGVLAAAYPEQAVAVGTVLMAFGVLAAFVAQVVLGIRTSSADNADSAPGPAPPTPGVQQARPIRLRGKEMSGS